MSQKTLHSASSSFSKLPQTCDDPTYDYFLKKIIYCLKTRFLGLSLVKCACVRPNSVFRGEKSIFTNQAKIKTVWLNLSWLNLRAFTVYWPFRINLGRTHLRTISVRIKVHKYWPDFFNISADFLLKNYKHSGILQ